MIQTMFKNKKKSMETDPKSGGTPPPMENSRLFFFFFEPFPEYFAEQNDQALQFL